MRNVRCSKCHSLLAKEEDNALILRTGIGKRRVFHIFNKEDATITCWLCKEVNKIERKNGNELMAIKKKGRIA